MNLDQAPADRRQDRLEKWVFAFPWLLGWVDAATSWRRSDLRIRKKLFAMYAILETAPECSDLFLPRRMPPIYLVCLAWVGVRAVVKLICGTILLRVLR
jgi:hypothetical protein